MGCTLTCPVFASAFRTQVWHGRSNNSGLEQSGSSHPFFKVKMSSDAKQIAKPVAERPCKPCCVGKKMYKPQNLPIYGCPECPSKFEVIEKEPCQLESYVKTIRIAITPTLLTTKRVVDRGVEIVDTAVAHSRSSWTYVTSEGNATVKGMAIAGGCLGGILLARRGIFRRTILGSLGAGVIAANLYPEEYHKHKNESFKTVCGAVKDTTGYDLESQLTKIELPKPFDYMPKGLTALFGRSTEQKENPKKA